jgi:predicted enzyme related to lactoylglutathione lyase
MFTHIHFQTLGVLDYERALAFYRDVLGFEVERDNAYGDGRWIFMRLAGARTMLHFDRRAEIEKTETPVLVLVTEDVDAACARLREHGVAIRSGPDDAPWEPGTRWAMIDDSEGNLLLIQTIRKGQDNG